MRADQLLVDHGLASSRSQAQRLIAAGVLWRVGAGAWQPVRKNGDELPAGAELCVQDGAEARYVSRGGLKLEGALRQTGLEVRGLRCLDVGQSTGGFTDCLLQHGASSVVGVDVGHGQLHPRLRNDTRVLALEGTNARYLTPAQLLRVLTDYAPDYERFDTHFDLVTGDVSFISLTLVLPALVPLLRPGGQVLMLVKPQFELQPAQIGKGGIVRNAALYAQVEQRICACCAELGLQVVRWFDSPIAGGDGNREFFVHATKA